MDNTQAQLYQHFISQATSTVTQAIEADNAGKYSIAVGLYVSATVLYMKALENVSDEDFKRRVKVEVSKYLQRAKDLRELEKQQTQPTLKSQAHQQLQQIQQQQQALKQQKAELQQQWNSPIQPPQPQSKPQPQQPSIQPQSQQSQPTSQNTGLLGSIMNKFSHAGSSNTPSNPTKPTKQPKQSHKKKTSKSRKDSDDEGDSEDSEEASEKSSESEKESTDEEGDAQVEDLVKQVQREENKGKNEDGEEDEGDGGDEEKEGESKGEEKEKEYFTEVPDEETLKTIDRLLMEEEKRVQTELQQTSVVDNRIADKIAQLGSGIKLGLDDKGGDLDDDVLHELIMESRIEALNHGGKPKSKPKKTNK